MFGRGGHGSAPETTVDPVVMAAATVMRLQTVVSREIAMTDDAVVTVGSLQAGTSANIIPDQALLRLNVRTFDDQVRDRVLSAIKRIVAGEATTSGAPKPPAFTTLNAFPLTVNDEGATRKGDGSPERALGRRSGAASWSRLRERRLHGSGPRLERAFGVLAGRGHRPEKVCGRREDREPERASVQPLALSSRRSWNPRCALASRRCLRPLAPG